jgi:alkylation response protein AidB-like acyl-CoA dehydrogenase
LYSPPPVDSDYYKILDVLDAKERTIAQRVREFAEAEVAPIIEDDWLRDEFPHEIIPKLSALNIAGIGYLGYGAAGGSWVLDGPVAMELSRVDSSMAHRSLGRLDLSVRRRRAKGALAAGDDALGEDRLVRVDRAAGGLRDLGRDAHDVPSRR